MRVAAFVEVDPRKIGQRIHGAPVVGVRRRGRPAPARCTWARSASAARASASAREAARLGLVDGAAT